MSISRIQVHYALHRQQVLMLCQRNNYGEEEEVYTHLYRQWPLEKKQEWIARKGVAQYEQWMQKMFKGRRLFGYFISVPNEFGVKNVVGFLLFHLHDASQTSELLHILIDSRCRSRGLGTQLMLRYLEAMYHSGYKDIAVPNPLVPRFFARFGLSKATNDAGMSLLTREVDDRLTM